LALLYKWFGISRVTPNFRLAIENYANADNPQLEFGKSLKKAKIEKTKEKKL